VADLSGLGLYRNDPELAARLIAQAEAGDMDAQYAAGLIYAEGRGVQQDAVQSYYWLTRALKQGDADAERLRSHVAAQMSEAEFSQARRLVRLAAASGSQMPGAAGSGSRH
jgi:TPR repeat protein